MIRRTISKIQPRAHGQSSLVQQVCRIVRDRIVPKLELRTRTGSNISLIFYTSFNKLKVKGYAARKIRRSRLVSSTPTLRS